MLAILHLFEYVALILTVNLNLNILGSSKEIVLSETDSDEDSFAGFKKRGRKIVFSDDEDDDLSPPKIPTSKGTLITLCLKRNKQPIKIIVVSLLFAAFAFYNLFCRLYVYTKQT